MGCLGRKTLSLLLVFMLVYLHGASSQETGPARLRKPFFERLRRLEEQFRRFQEVTLTHLQSIASNYNVSYNIDARFQSLEEERQAMALAANRSQAIVQGDLAQLKTWVRKSKRRSQKVEARLQALDLTLSAQRRQRAQEGKEQKAQREAMASLSQAMQAMQDTLAGLTHQIHSHGARLAILEGRLWMDNHGTTAPAGTLALTPSQPAKPGPGSLQLQRDRQTQGLSTLQNHPEDASPLPLRPPAPSIRQTLTPPKDPPQLAWPPQRWGHVCNVGPVFIFPNASTQNVISFNPGFLTALRALSFCSWVRTAAGHLGTLLSYATQENDNKLVLHGRDSLAPGSIHFVIGDPAFRELPLQPLLDGQWHHVCIVWTSTEGRYWLHVDRRLVATGSRFRVGYEIPPGGSLVVGQEQDCLGGGFDSAEAFVGTVAGLAIWDRVLVPGEIADLASGRKLPTDAVLTLANATSVEGFVGRISCSCLEHCP
ncbi:pentraxin-4 isoform X1 [Perognathus longimembris pacificus]|uniref:pentraxin-4 isoform X1 n=1 Tax=Perognathus longimembris pacificus TaxID=214514 RepID=UPI0020193798|nr:pentraxin-4 isoform X1 [Perognathus longimembris pacificus]